MICKDFSAHNYVYVIIVCLECEIAVLVATAVLVLLTWQLATCTLCLGEGLSDTS